MASLQEFGVQIELFGLNADDLSEYQQLLSTVQADMQTSGQ